MMNREIMRAGAILTIDVDAIRENYQLLRTRAGAAQCAAVLKADAYGLGAARIAPALLEQGCNHFFVAHVDEGISLRRVLPRSTNVFVLHGAPPGAEAELAENGLVPVINSLNEWKAWQRQAHKLGRRLPAIMQIDTGMSRLGFSPQEVCAWLEDPDRLEGVRLGYLMSHLAVAEAHDHPMNAYQLRRFSDIHRQLGRVPATFANSSGIFLGSVYHFDLVRPGAALYGINPTPGSSNPMRQVVTLQAKIIQARTLEPGDHVGYGLSYRASSTRRIATVSIGYADGWMRSLGNCGAVVISGVRAPLVGRVSMDTLTVDVSNVDPAHVIPGAMANLICGELTVDEVAEHAGTIGYEILTGLGSRFHRRYVSGTFHTLGVKENVSHAG